MDSTTFDNGYALLIAVDESAVPEAALPDVANDVAALRRVLADPERCGYRPEHINVRQGKDASRDGILAGLAWLGEKLAADPSGNATALIYYTGHGHVADGRFFLVPYDVKPGFPQLALLPAEDFAAAVGSLQPRRLLVMLDCCRAAGMQVKSVLPFAPAAIPPALFMGAERGVTPRAGGKGLEALARGAGRAVLSSSQAGELSYVRGDRLMSIFTYHLIAALTGHTQPEDGAREVLVSDVMSYVTRHVPESAQAEYHTEQNPDFNITGNFAVAQLLGGKGLAKGALLPDPLEAAGKPLAPGTHIGAIDARGSQGMIIDAKGPVIQHFGDEVHTEGGAFVRGNVNLGPGAKFTGRDSFEWNSTTNQVTQIEQLFEPIMRAAESAPPEQRAAAVAAAGELQAEASKSGGHDDSRMARLVDGLVALAPGAAAAVASAFGTPILAGVAGPVTKYVLDRLQGR